MPSPLCGQYVNQYNWFSDVQKRDWTKACQHNMIYVTNTLLRKTQV